MTSPERVNALIEAVRYVIRNGIEGAFVECGVWKGGSAMAMALALKQLGDESRDLCLYDTFTGMTTPDERDVSIDGINASKMFATTNVDDDDHKWFWCRSPLDEVTANVLGTGYPKDKVRFIQGKVEDTIPAEAPQKIALLRLDTDWYASTKHELIHLYPRLQPHGVLIIDDYGDWEGARRAVDEFIAEKDIHILLNRIDATGRIAIKV
jgi:hypothetical protein